MAKSTLRIILDLVAKTNFAFLVPKLEDEFFPPEDSKAFCPDCGRVVPVNYNLPIQFTPRRFLFHFNKDGFECSGSYKLLPGELPHE